VGRIGNQSGGFRSPCHGIAGHLTVPDAARGGRLCCPGKGGRSEFNQFLFWRGRRTSDSLN
jgi:hypothetical protein